MRTATIELTSGHEAAFLAEFFWGMANGIGILRGDSEGKPVTESQRVAGGNFRRVYKILTEDEKKAVRSSIASFTNYSQNSIDALIETLIQFRDEI